MDRYLTFFHTTQFKLWSLHTLKYFITHIHIKLGCKLTFSLLLTFGELHFHLLCRKVVFYFLYLNYTPFKNNSEISYLKYHQYTFHMYQTTYKLQSRTFRIFGVYLLFSIVYMNFYMLIKSISKLTYVYLQYDWKFFTKIIFSLLFSILGHDLDVGEKCNLSCKKHAKFYLKSTTY
jgi:hypothetical protein